MGSFQCPHCKKNFSLKKNLNRHLKNHLIESGFNCNICDKKLQSKYNLNCHTIAIHQEKKISNSAGIVLFNSKELVSRLQSDWKEICNFHHQIVQLWNKLILITCYELFIYWCLVLSNLAPDYDLLNPLHRRLRVLGFLNVR